MSVLDALKEVSFRFCFCRCKARIHEIVSNCLFAPLSSITQFMHVLTPLEFASHSFAFTRPAYRSSRRPSSTTVSRRVCTSAPRPSTAAPPASAASPRTARTRSTRSSSAPSAPRARSPSSWSTPARTSAPGAASPSSTRRATSRRPSALPAPSSPTSARRPVPSPSSWTTSRSRPTRSKLVQMQYLYQNKIRMRRGCGDEWTSFVFFGWRREKAWHLLCEVEH